MAEWNNPALEKSRSVEPLTAVTVGAGAVKGLTDLFTGLFGGGGPETLSPEAQLYLAERGLNLQEISDAWNQSAQKFQLGLQAAQYGYDSSAQSAYNDYFTEPTNEFASYATDALSGKTTAGANQQITDLGIQAGKQGQQSEAEIIQNAQQRGIPLESKFVQDQLNKARSENQSAYLGGSAQIRTADYENSIKNALYGMGMFANAKRLAGAQAPDAPIVPSTWQEALNAGAKPATAGSRSRSPFARAGAYASQFAPQKGGTVRYGNVELPDYAHMTREDFMHAQAPNPSAFAMPTTPGNYGKVSGYGAGLSNRGAPTGYTNDYYAAQRAYDEAKKKWYYGGMANTSSGPSSPYRGAYG